MTERLRKGAVRLTSNRHRASISRQVERVGGRSAPGRLGLGVLQVGQDGVHRGRGGPLRLPGVHLLCPKTGQPDFAVIHVDYVPDALCVELKSWKLYLWSYRDEGAFHEAVTNRILNDLVAATQPGGSG